MCDFGSKLAAWIDGELPAEEAAELQRHLELCAECGSAVKAYRQASSVFENYCDAYSQVTMAVPRSGHRSRAHVLAIPAGLGAAAAVALVFFIGSHSNVPQLPYSAVASKPAAIAAADAPPALQRQPVAPSTAPAPRTEPHPAIQQRTHTVARRQTEEPNWPRSEPAFEIAFPGDAIFPPGAFPEGMGFTADVTIGPDGSPQQIRIQPEVTAFERRPARP